jgi:hypothetical protein
VLRGISTVFQASVIDRLCGLDKPEEILDLLRREGT